MSTSVNCDQKQQDLLATNDVAELAFESPVADKSTITVGPTETTTTGSISNQPNQMSKNQLKKLKRWEQKMVIKQRRKEQERAAKVAKALAVGRDIEEERRQQAATYGKGRMRQYKLDKWKARLQQGSSLQICVDGSFESSMTAKEINSLALQLRYCYASNRRCCSASGNALPCGYTFTSSGGETLKHLQNVSGFDEWKNWGFQHSPLSLGDYYKDKLSQVVYLTCDSEHTLTELASDKIYVIGGIVDRNRLKRAAMDRAEALGVSTAKLPIDDHLKKMPSTRVLTCNHVFDLLLKCREHNGDWKKALMEVLPTRKDAQFNDVEQPDQIAAK
ncbi:hypothetical protein MPSEU_000469100 [Mayamaea pseudoterrestris]|nr:hypothetical protein MPSEU_000469100 [Mayamaea pseudoterrestris]